MTKSLGLTSRSLSSIARDARSIRSPAHPGTGGCAWVLLRGVWSRHWLSDLIARGLRGLADCPPQ